MKKMMMLLMMLVLVVGCKSDAEKFAELLQDYYTNVVSQSINVEVMKDEDDTLRDGWAVFKLTYQGEVFYFAGDLNNFDPKELDNYEDLEAWANATNWESLTVEPVFGQSGVYEDYLGNLYETTTASAKDLEKIGAVKEFAAREKMAKKLTADFGFSIERAREVAKFTSNFSQISKTRKLTEADYNAFSKELVGVDYAELNRALDGDFEMAAELIDIAAEKNEVSPEAIRALMQEAL